MIRKICSAVAILLQIRLNLSMLSQDKDTRVVRVPVGYRLMLTASLPHPLRHIPGLRRPPCFFAGVERLQGRDGAHRSALNTPKP